MEVQKGSNEQAKKQTERERERGVVGRGGHPKVSEGATAKYPRNFSKCKSFGKKTFCKLKKVEIG